MCTWREHGLVSAVRQWIELNEGEGGKTTTPEESGKLTLIISKGAREEYKVLVIGIRGRPCHANPVLIVNTISFLRHKAAQRQLMVSGCC